MLISYLLFAYVFDGAIDLIRTTKKNIITMITVSRGKGYCMTKC